MKTLSLKSWMTIGTTLSFSLITPLALFAAGATGGGPTAPGAPGQPSQPQHSSQPTPPKKPTERPYESKRLKKELLPVMDKPFGMPGVVGWLNGKWEGNDFLGMLSNHITIDIEVVEGEKVPKISQDSLLNTAKDVFVKQTLTPRADVEEGPQLPLFHILLLVYPVDADKFVIFANGRLFESVEVKRKDFEPKGYWQAITWETQDIIMVNEKDLESSAKASVEKVTEAFVKRYREYNAENPDLPKPAPLENSKQIPTNESIK